MTNLLRKLSESIVKPLQTSGNQPQTTIAKQSTAMTELVQHLFWTDE